MPDISKDILGKIKKKKLRPYPKQYFFLKRSVIWVVFSLSIFFGSIACAITLFQLRYAQWDLYKHLTHSLTEFVLLVIPFFWLTFLLGFTWLAYYYFRRTERGYQYTAIWVVLLSITLSIIIGGFLYSTGLSEKLEFAFQENLPFYKELQESKQKVWMSPEHGLLAGKIIKIISDQKMEIKDLKGSIWVIDIADSIWRGRLRPVKNLKIKILGKMLGQNQFKADEIRPWKRRRGSGKKKYLQRTEKKMKEKIPSNCISK